MAGVDDVPGHGPGPEAERRWNLARRTDLAGAFGLLLSVPAHGQDAQGNWEYGRIPVAGMASEAIANEFQDEMSSVINLHTQTLLPQGFLTAEQAMAVDSHRYSVGPAAQEWPKFFFELYRDARPFLSDGASLLAWGYFFKDVFRGIVSWASSEATKSV